VVTGKGGVGKTVVSAALGLAAAKLGKRVLLAEVEGRQAFARVFGTPPLGYRETEVYPGVSALHVVPGEALLEYLRLFYGLPGPTRTLLRARVLEFATEVAPGLRDILLIGKVKEAVSRRKDSHFQYDLVVLDAPPAGRVLPFLSAPRAVMEVVRTGPVRVQAEGVARLLSDPRTTAAVVVAIPEEMPVVEAEQASRELKESLGLGVAGVVLNRVRGPLAPLPARRNRAGTGAAEATTAGGQVLTQAREWGWELAPQDKVGLVGAASSARERQKRERAYRARLARLGAPVLSLPQLPVVKVGRAEAEALAEALLGALRRPR
jgi:anion-transporting  ArsA/GET3 family ATPase